MDFLGADGIYTLLLIVVVIGVALFLIARKVK